MPSFRKHNSKKKKVYLCRRSDFHLTVLLHAPELEAWARRMCAGPSVSASSQLPSPSPLNHRTTACVAHTRYPKEIQSSTSDQNWYANGLTPSYDPESTAPASRRRVGRPVSRSAGSGGLVVGVTSPSPQPPPPTTCFAQIHNAEKKSFSTQSNISKVELLPPTLASLIQKNGRIMEGGLGGLYRRAGVVAFLLSPSPLPSPPIACTFVHKTK